MTYTTKNSILKYLLSTFFLVLSAASVKPVMAQSIGFGADIANRYVWRGIDFGNSASVQPYIEFTAGDFTFGTWASYAVSPVSAGASEHDLYASYSFGAVSIGITDYYFPTGSEFFDFKAFHVIEPNITVGGTESFPVTLYGAININGDPDDSIYLEASVPFRVGETELGFTVGGVPAETAYYGTTDAGIINMNISVSREATITESFSLPLFASYVLNPYAEQSYLVFGFSL